MEFLALIPFIFNLLPKLETMTGQSGLSAKVLGAIQTGQAWLGLITEAMNSPDLDPIVAAEVNLWMKEYRDARAKSLEGLKAEFDSEQAVIDQLKKEREADEAF